MPSSAASLDRAARLLSRGRAQPPMLIGDLPDALRPGDVSEAMKLQDALNERLAQSSAGPVVGTKIGCTTAVMQQYLGMTHPCSGAIFASTIRHREGEFSFDSFPHVGKECEIAVELASTIEAGPISWTRQQLAAQVRSVHAAIEIVTSTLLGAFRIGEPRSPTTFSEPARFWDQP